MHNEAISDDNYSIINGSFNYLIPYSFHITSILQNRNPQMSKTVKVIETENLILIIHY